MKRLLLLLSFLAIIIPSAQAQESIFTQDIALKRYLGMVEMGFLFGNRSSGSGHVEASPSVVVFNGYQFHRAFALGATVGLDAYEEITLTSLALGMRGSVGTRRVRPFYALDLGYSTTHLNKDRERVQHQGGWMVNPTAGVLIGAGHYTAFTLGVGYKRQRALSEYTFWNGGATIQNAYSFKHLSVRMGIQF